MRTTMLRTVEIIGGGLAGLSLGIGLRARGIPVRLIEAGTYPRHRVCGEFITGLDQHTRATLQLDPILQPALPAHGASWCEPGRPTIRHFLPRPALCLSRYRLDADMARAFCAAGGDLQTRQRASADPAEGRVVACGRRPHSASPWIGLKQHFRAFALGNDLEVHLGKSAYVGLTRVEGGLVNVCGLFPRPRKGEPCTLIGQIRSAGLSALADRVASAEAVEDSDCAVAGLDYANRTDKCASLGDHQGLIPPFTGNGMTIALQSAAMAVDHFEAWSRGSVSWPETVNRVSRALRRRFRWRLFVARLMHPWMLHERRRAVVHGLHQRGLLPFRLLYQLSH